MITESWPEKEARLRKLGFSDTDLAKARPRKKSKKAKAGHPSEYEEQKEFVKWIRKEHPEHKRRLLMIGNASHRGDLMRASMDKASGLMPGASDLFFRFSAGGFHGLWIEMKTVVGKLTPDETTFLREAAADGYYGVCCQGAAKAKAVFEGYLRGDHARTSPR